MPHTAELVEALRGNGVAAVVSGAGPSVLVLGEFPEPARALIPQGWRRADTSIAREGAHLVPELAVG